MKYEKEELRKIISALNDLALSIKTLPIEIFQDIWIKLDVTIYTNVLLVEYGVPALKEYIQESVIELDFNGGTTISYPQAISKKCEDFIGDKYPNLKYVDHLNIYLYHNNIKEVSTLNYLRNVSLAGCFDYVYNVDLIHDIMINIIKRNKGNVKVSLNVTYHHTNNIVNYDNGIIEVSNKYRIEKIKEMRPEILVIKNSLDHIDLLKLALLPTIKGLLIDINIDENMVDDDGIHIARNIPNIYSITNTLLYIDENDTSESIKSIYNSEVIGTMEEKRENKIESIRYRYVDKVQDKLIEYDGDKYWTPLQECTGISHLFYPVKIFPNLKYMSVPISDGDIESWEQIAPNAKHLRSEHDAYLEGLNKKIEKLKLIITGYEHEIQKNSQKL